MDVNEVMQELIKEIVANAMDKIKTDDFVKKVDEILKEEIKKYENRLTRLERRIKKLEEKLNDGSTAEEKPKRRKKSV